MHRALLSTLVLLLLASLASGQDLSLVRVEGQPLAANVKRLLQALDYLGAPLPVESTKALKLACDDHDATKIQRLLDPHVLLSVHLNPEVRVKVARGPAKAALQQAGYTPVLVKVTNESTATKPLRISSRSSSTLPMCPASCSQRAYSDLCRLAGQNEQCSRSGTAADTSGRRFGRNENSWQVPCHARGDWGGHWIITVICGTCK